MKKLPRLLTFLTVMAALWIVTGAAVVASADDGDDYNEDTARAVTTADAGKTIKLHVGDYFNVRLPDGESEISWGSDAEENFRVKDGKPIHIWTIPQKLGEERGGPEAKDAFDVFLYRAAKVGKQSLSFSFDNGDEKKKRTVTFNFVIEKK